MSGKMTMMQAFFAWVSLGLLGVASLNGFVVSAFAPARPIRYPNAAVATTTTPMTVVYAKKKKRKKYMDSSSSSISSSSNNSMGPFLKLAFQGSNNAKNPMESGFETALMLTDKKRQVEFKKDLKQQFPLVPGFVLDICIDSLADAFSSVAPSQLKAALKPGGLEKVRPELEDTIVENLQKQTMLDSVPLTKGDKKQLLQYLVSSSLDYLLKDAQEVLAEPSVRLQALEAQKRQIQKFMPGWQLTWYRIRYFPVQMTVIGLVAAITSYAIFQQYLYKHTALVSAVTGVCVTMVSSMKVISAKVSAIMLSITSGKGLKRTAVRRVVRR
jgi:hypothetical protein